MRELITRAFAVAAALIAALGLCARPLPRYSLFDTTPATLYAGQTRSLPIDADAAEQIIDLSLDAHNRYSLQARIRLFTVDGDTTDLLLDVHEQPAVNDLSLSKTRIALRNSAENAEYFIPNETPLSRRHDHVRITVGGGRLFASYGESTLSEAGSVAVGAMVDSIAITALTDFDILRLSCRLTPLPALEFVDIPTIFASDDRQAGIWKFFDENIETKFARKGGLYTLAIVPDGDGYVIAYLEGASINDNRWTRGRVKGRLRPTPFASVYDLVWLDSDGYEVEGECSATFDNGLVTFNFPRHSSRLRFIRQL